MNIFQKISEKERTFLGTRLVLFTTLINILVLVVAVFFLVSIGKMLHGEEKTPAQMNVAGEGSIFIRPDIAEFNVTIVAEQKRVGDAQNDNTVRSNAVVNFLKQSGIQENDIKTVEYSVSPQYQYDKSVCPRYPCVPRPPRIISFEVRHSLEVKVRDLKKVDQLLEGVVSVGASEVGSVSFTVDDEKAAMAQARQKAITDAKQKAQVLAGDLGVRLVKIVGFSESGGGFPIFDRAVGMAAEAKQVPQVQPGQQEIQSSVTITYEFR